MEAIYMYINPKVTTSAAGVGGLLVLSADFIIHGCVCGQVNDASKD